MTSHVTDAQKPADRVRLHKALAEAGVASRRACERLIAEGAVEVNGVPVTTTPAWIDPARDQVTVEGRRVKLAPRHVYVLLFKPRGVVCTSAGDESRPRAIDLVDHPSKSRLYPVGRLPILIVQPRVLIIIIIIIALNTVCSALSGGPAP